MDAVLLVAVVVVVLLLLPPQLPKRTSPVITARKHPSVAVEHFL
jgi:hypothetical protein